jgi:hypothetical protein
VNHEPEPTTPPPDGERGAVVDLGKARARRESPDFRPDSPHPGSADFRPDSAPDSGGPESPDPVPDSQRPESADFDPDSDRREPV